MKKYGFLLAILTLLTCLTTPGAANADVIALPDFLNNLNLIKTPIDILEGEEGTPAGEVTNVPLDFTTNNRGGALIILDTLPDGGITNANQETILCFLQVTTN